MNKKEKKEKVEALLKDKERVAKYLKDIGAASDEFYSECFICKAQGPCRNIKKGDCIIYYECVDMDGSWLYSKTGLVYAVRAVSGILNNMDRRIGELINELQN